MKQYSHDYTLVSDAESHLYAAQQLEAHEQPEEAWKHIADARRLLQQYLSQDNMVLDDDVADGWVKANEAEEAIGDLKNLCDHYRETMLAIGRTSAEVVRRSEETVRENEQLKAKVVRTST